jgi:putative methionine-R-sulfoxide reductase with GAF domain
LRAGDRFIAVLDIDSAGLNTFDHRDQDTLERIVRWLTVKPTSVTSPRASVR